MGTVVMIVRIMPESPSTDLNEIQVEAKKRLEAQGANNITFEEKPIAFGLKAVMIKFATPEDKGSDLVESELSAIAHVSSATIEDYRRAFG